MSPAAWWLVMASTDSPGPGQQIEINTPLHGGLQLRKVTKKNNHVPYIMGCWKCCPTSSTHFWHLFRKCAFTCIDSISETQSISPLILAFNSSNVWEFVVNTLFFMCPPQIKIANPHTLEEWKASITYEIDYISNGRNVWMKEENISKISCYKGTVRDYFSL